MARRLRCTPVLYITTGSGRRRGSSRGIVSQECQRCKTNLSWSIDWSDTRGSVYGRQQDAPRSGADAGQSLNLAVREEAYPPLTRHEGVCVGLSTQRGGFGRDPDYRYSHEPAVK